MSHRWLLFLLCLVVAGLFFVPASRARLTLRVNEAETRLSLTGNNPQLLLAVDNGSGKTVSAIMHLDLLDVDDHAKASGAPTVTLPSGSHKIPVTIPLKLSSLNGSESSKLLWYRVRYRIEPQSSDAVDPVSGIISLSEITPDLFQLRVFGSRMVHEGSRFYATVRAQHPVTNRPARGVQITGTLKIDDGDTDETITFSSEAVSNDDGYAMLSFKLPARINSDDVDLTVKGKRGSVEAKAVTSLELPETRYAFISTDKALYQPGQTLHARVLMFSPSKHALANKAVTMEVRDPDNQVVYSADLTTTKFGIASSDWSIPNNTSLGSYEVQFTSEDDEISSSKSVKISRYDLPNFTVNASSDHPYYLPGQQAEVTISGTYLFGQPVKHGKVRVVRELERNWNYKEQKYETKESQTYTGETDANGVFRTNINLDKDHAELDDTDYERFQDLRFAAYFTDATTNRTEQRRFDLRITKSPIHIYVVSADYTYAQSLRLPLDFYVSASYADGKPAQCRITIDSFMDQPGGGTSRVIKTNRDGLARVKRFPIPGAAENRDNVTLKFLATDNKGRTGTYSERFYMRDQPALRIETDKSLYRSGEPIEITLTSSEENANVVLEVARDEAVVHSEVVRLHNHHAVVSLPPNKELTDLLSIRAYGDFGEDNGTFAHRTVLFPRDQELKLKVEANHSEYRPGADTHLDLRVRNSLGRATEGALGVVVLDKAVEERARTDEEFGERYRDTSDDWLQLLGNGDRTLGVNLRALSKIDLTKPISPDEDLLAEVLLCQSVNEYPQVFGSSDYETNVQQTFVAAMKNQLTPLRDTLQEIYDESGRYPVDDESLKKLLTEKHFQSLPLDPWDTAYRTHFAVNADRRTLTVTTAGPDKVFDSGDDFSFEVASWHYFMQIGGSMDVAVMKFHERTGSFIRDRKTLDEELARLGINSRELRDPWQQPYEFEFGVRNNFYEITVSSSGPNKKFERNENGDDVHLWVSSIDYFTERRMALETALTAAVASAQPLLTETQVTGALLNARIDWRSWRDAWDQPFYLTFDEVPFYGDNVRVRTTNTVGGKPTDVIEVHPVTKRIETLSFRSRGPDATDGTSDDFTAASFSFTLSEQRASELLPLTGREPFVFTGSTGAIKGIITDPNSAVVPGAKVSAARDYDRLAFSATTDEDGRYLLKNLPVGMYTISISSPGFQNHTVSNVLVHSSTVIQIDAMLSPGAITEAVMVTGGVMNSMTVDVANTEVSSRSITRIAGNRNPQKVSTPRLRQYFPETLVWQPALETDKQGRAQLDFKLADSITTWKMAVIGSTEDGQIGVAEKEIKAFQPFFVEHDPPRVLTAGDEISLPVVVRNYLDKPQTVSLELKPENWFSSLGPTSNSAKVDAGEAARETFDIRATSFITDGKQRITARADDASDAIEKPVTVHPDGEERSVVDGSILRKDAIVNLELPHEAIPGSVQSELKIYPSLISHVVEGIEAIMKRPYGCGEQTISSTYPSLLLLRYLKATGTTSPLSVKAEEYLRDGYARLLNYRSSSGGFTYWGSGDPDPALTAYAFHFLTEARAFVNVDPDLIGGARGWLLKNQNANGSWTAKYYGVEDERRSTLLTAYIVRVLAHHKAEAKDTAAIERALAYAAAQAGRIDEPFLLASYALATQDAGDISHAGESLRRLASLAHVQGSTTYWNLETNTPFYGWGTAGRVETTALSVQAFARGCEAAPQATECQHALVDQGLLFLLKNKDRYGVWYSSQATINVLETMLNVLASPNTNANAGPSAADIFINGKLISSVELRSDRRISAPITVDLAAYLKASSNVVEVRGTGDLSTASVQAVASFYVPWVPTLVPRNEATRPGDSEGLRLVTRFNRTSGNVSDEVSCHVEAERIGFRGYGMLLAEVGLPPGADVDRASLEKAVKESGWGINHYDIQPDRVVFYLWPRAGGIAFDFNFQPRFGLKAKSAPSTIYDYYNPESRAVVAPTAFVFK